MKKAIIEEECMKNDGFGLLTWLVANKELVDFEKGNS